MNQLEVCNNTSVGALVSRGGSLLLIERRNPPFGFAPPAGHVDDGEDWAAGVLRELWEETGLCGVIDKETNLGRRDNQCRRPGGSHHWWRVYHVTTMGRPERSTTETRSLVWADPAELGRLVERTRLYREGMIHDKAWEREPGLEPVWLDMLTELNPASVR